MLRPAASCLLARRSAAVLAAEARRRPAGRCFAFSPAAASRGQPEVLRIAAFAKDGAGGNPAGVALRDALPPVAEMQRIAAEVGFSETAFAARSGDQWLVRYFAPEVEVAFCGHATIALGAALAMRHGDGTYPLSLRSAQITVEGRREGGLFAGALQSPPTSSAVASDALVSGALALFGYAAGDLDPRIPPSIVDAGNRHLLMALSSRRLLAQMSYDMAAGRRLMDEADLVTIILVFAEDDQHFHMRNPFASGGVYEDPATGSAAAAFGGCLRDLDWPHGGQVKIIQGEDMGMASAITVDIPPEKGSSVRVSGVARLME